MQVFNNVKIWIPFLLITALNLASCNKYEEGPYLSLRTKTNRLTGNWEVVKIDGYTLSSDGSLVLIDFEKNGDFSMLSSFNDGFGSYSNVREVGEWEWENRKEEVEITGSTFREDWEIIQLTNRELWFETANRSLWKCEKN